MKRLVSGIKPTGDLTLGNYIGAIKQFVDMQNELEDTEFFIFIADLHAITTPQDRLVLRNNIKKIAALYIACGLDPEKVNIFIQSEVKEHLMLNYIIESTLYVGEMERMIQYKEKRANQEEAIRTSLLTYPALMAADILLYDANLVPVGEDQMQHLELTKTAGNRFNYLYGDTFVIPEGITPKTGARIMGLQNPTSKMSKSDDKSDKDYILLIDDLARVKNKIKSAVTDNDTLVKFDTLNKVSLSVTADYILLIDDLARVKNKIKSAVTDNDTLVKFDTLNKPGISNLLTIYSVLTNTSIKDLEEKYKDSNYGTFKSELADVVVNFLEPIQNTYNKILKSKELDDILDRGRDRASLVASRKIDKVYHKVGLGRKK